LAVEKTKITQKEIFLLLSSFPRLATVFTISHGEVFSLAFRSYSLSFSLSESFSLSLTLSRRGATRSTFVVSKSVKLMKLVGKSDFN
jgi:hypothetical protein